MNFFKLLRAHAKLQTIKFFKMKKEELIKGKWYLTSADIFIKFDHLRNGCDI